MKVQLASVLALGAMIAAPMAARAQDAARVYDNGPVWEISSVQTKPGHFDDYMKFLSTTWRAEQEDAKRRGLVLDYKILTAQDARDNAPDLYLMVEYRNMAALDEPLDARDASAKRLFGSMSGAASADLQRESIRTLRGAILTRELILK